MSNTSNKNSLVATIFPSGQPNDSGTQTAKLNVILPKDIVMFVPGTTDPINTTALEHQANKEYWRNVKEDQKNLWKSVKELKPQYLDLHIEDTFFSWSGDNNHDERVIAAERLLDLFMRVYPNWTEKSVHLHLIGHSHGGNVINEFTNTIANAPNFPAKWKIKSLTYLSTPFFQQQHQLNHSKLHPKCKIINVRNEYDLTQRVVADFTLKNLEILIQNFNGEDLEKALNRIKEANTAAFDHLTDLVINNHTEGPFLWGETAILLDGIRMLFQVIIDMIEKVGDTGILSSQKRLLITRLTAIRDWATTQGQIFENNRVNRNGGYGRSEYIEDLNPAEALRQINILLAIQTGIADSFLLNLLASIAETNASGISDIIDDTLTNPQQQVKGAFRIVDIPIFTKDPYHTRNKKANFDRFVSGLENCVRAKRPDMLQEILIRLISQFTTAESMRDVASKLNLLEYIVTGDLDTQVKRLKTNITVYSNLVARFNADLVTPADRDNNELTEKPGSVPYLAMVSHSLSHTKLFDEVKDALTSSFSSGKNPGYKPN
ncbi:hypothetical protein ACE193_25480 (plasmid) [Bernardetia sp. OM2101]|uniref:hypothetical protein n=1 Tax=Bernardetia sp. OM2101 TaxID=3344876 RepID=UPI0035CF3807